MALEMLVGLTSKIEINHLHLITLHYLVPRVHFMMQHSVEIIVLDFTILEQKKTHLFALILMPLDP